MVPWARLELAEPGFLDRYVCQFHHQGMFGVTNGEWSHSIAFTERGAKPLHYGHRKLIGLQCGIRTHIIPRPKRGAITRLGEPEIKLIGCGNSFWTVSTLLLGIQNTKMRGQGMLLKAKAYETPRPLGSPHLCTLNFIYHFKIGFYHLTTNANLVRNKRIELFTSTMSQ